MELIIQWLQPPYRDPRRMRFSVKQQTLTARVIRALEKWAKEEPQVYHNKDGLPRVAFYKQSIYVDSMIDIAFFVESVRDFITQQYDALNASINIWMVGI